MDATQFDHAVRAIEAGRPRRRVLGALFAASLATPLLGLSPAVETDARKKRKKRRKNRKKIRRNGFGCVNVGQKCYGRHDVCCSGICDGTGKRSVCAGHNAESCAPTTHTCLEQGTGTCGGGGGSCFTTTGNAPFCGELGLCDCAPCAFDADCVAEHGAGAACIQCAGTTDGFCTGVNGSGQGTACVPAWKP